jgi:hypothetical protein
MYDWMMLGIGRSGLTGRIHGERLYENKGGTPLCDDRVAPDSR